MITMVPTTHPSRIKLQRLVDGLNAIGRFKVQSDLGKESQPVQSERVFQAFLQTTSGAAIETLKLPADGQKPALRPSVARLFIGGLQLRAKDVLAFLA
jgi:hypothetical protein